MAYKDFLEACQSGLKGVIRCPFDGCNARVIKLSPQLTDLQVKVDGAPRMVEIKGKSTSDVYFKLEDVWDFDNIAVSKPADQLKDPEVEGKDGKIEFKIERYLMCGECDKGPIGFAGYENGERDIKKLKSFLSVSSVLYDIE